MTEIVILNSGDIPVTTNGVSLAPAECRGLLTPVMIEGVGGKVNITVNPDPNVQEAVYDDDGNLFTQAVRAAPVWATLSSAGGIIAVIPQNTRYPANDALIITDTLTVE